MELLGTAASKGTPVNGGPAGFCVHGFDNAGFLLGASSNIFVGRLSCDFALRMADYRLCATELVQCHQCVSSNLFWL